MSEKPDLNAISHDLHAVRKEKLALLRAAGEDPYRAEWAQTHVSNECAPQLPEGVEEGPEVSVAGPPAATRVPPPRPPPPRPQRGRAAAAAAAAAALTFSSRRPPFSRPPPAPPPAPRPPPL